MSGGRDTRWFGRETLREKKSAQASAEGWAAEVARAEELYEELRERAPQHCRPGGKPPIF